MTITASSLPVSRAGSRRRRRRRPSRGRARRRVEARYGRYWRRPRPPAPRAPAAARSASRRAPHWRARGRRPNSGSRHRCRASAATPPRAWSSSSPAGIASGISEQQDRRRSAAPGRARGPGSPPAPRSSPRPAAWAVSAIVPVRRKLKTTSRPIMNLAPISTPACGVGVAELADHPQVGEAEQRRWRRWSASRAERSPRSRGAAPVSDRWSPSLPPPR